jgi:hypothetical protein
MALHNRIHVTTSMRGRWMAQVVAKVNNSSERTVSRYTFMSLSIDGVAGDEEITHAYFRKIVTTLQQCVI